MRRERHDAWTDDELQVLYDLVNYTDWFDEARENLPLRSENAIRQRMSALRKEAEITPTRVGPTATFELRRTRRNAKAASDLYLSKLLAMVA